MRLTDVVDGAVVAAQDEEGPGGVVAADGNHILVLSAEHHTNTRSRTEALKVKSAHFTMLIWNSRCKNAEIILIVNRTGLSNIWRTGRTQNLRSGRVHQG